MLCVQEIVEVDVLKAVLQQLSRLVMVLHEDIWSQEWPQLWDEGVEIAILHNQTPQPA